MEVILLKSSTCLLAFIAFYKVFLERISNHQFKRFYLISIVLVSIGIPFITFIEYIEPQLILGDFSAMPWLNEVATTPPESTPTQYLPIILWSIYGVGVLLFSLRFINNLVHILLKIKRNPKKKTSRFISVLLQDLVVPHTFFSYIFLNKAKFESKSIPDEVLLHEETHVKQKHSLDIIFVELLQIIFWFNPLIYILKRDIKLNHEFLADQAVIDQGINTTTYQELLLAYSSHAEQPQLAHAINYSLIKKRFTVMKTQTSKQSFWIRSMLLLPLLAVLIYGFSSTKQVEKDLISKISANEIANTSNDTHHTARSITIEILSNGTYEIDGIKTTKNTFASVINRLHQDITPEIRNQIMNIHLNSKKEISNEEVWFIYNSLIDYGFHRIVSDNQEIIREKGNKPFAITKDPAQKQHNLIDDSPLNQQKGATPEQVAEYNKLASYYNKMFRRGGKMQVLKKDVVRLNYLYGLMSDAQKKKAEPFPDFPDPPPPPPPVKVKNTDVHEIPPPPPPAPANATPEQKAKYEKIHKEYNKKYKVKNGEVSRRLPPPPPPAPANATPEEKKKYKEAKVKYEKMKEREIALQKRVKEKQDAMKQRMIEREAEMVSRKKERELAMKDREQAMKERESRLVNERKAEMKLREKDRKLAMKEREAARKHRELAMRESQLNRSAEIVDVPPPPPPQSPLDHVIDMAKKGATFYFDGKKISSDEAIKLLKENNRINISSKNSNSNDPVVHLFSKPIKIENKEIPKPTAENIIDHIKVMNRHDAKFYLGNTPITYKEALKYVRKNRNADVRSSSATNVVIISKT